MKRLILPLAALLTFGTVVTVADAQTSPPPLNEIGANGKTSAVWTPIPGTPCYANGGNRLTPTNRAACTPTTSSTTSTTSTSSTTSTTSTTSSTTSTTLAPQPGPQPIAWDGGPAYWAQFPKAAAQGWTDPNFFPVGVWLQTAHNSAFFKGLGINVLMGANHDGANLAQIGQQTGMHYIVQADEYTKAEIGDNPYIVGHLASDEIDMNSQNPVPEQQAIVDELRSRADGRFVYSNYGKGAIGTWWNTEDLPELTKMVDVASDDLYFWSDPNIEGEMPQSSAWPQGATVRDSSSYGWTVDRMEEFLGSSLHPTWNFVETGHAFSEDWAPTITPDQLEGAVWQSIVHGARGIVFFNHNFGGPCPSQNALADCGPEMQERVKLVTARIRSLSPVLNSQSYMWDGGQGVSTMLKSLDGSWYLVSSLAQKSAPGSKTLNVPVSSGTATVVGESRTVPVVNGQIVDNFSSTNTMHVYQVAS